MEVLQHTAREHGKQIKEKISLTNKEDKEENKTKENKEESVSSVNNKLADCSKCGNKQEK